MHRTGMRTAVHVPSCVLAMSLYTGSLAAQPAPTVPKAEPAPEVQAPKTAAPQAPAARVQAPPAAPAAATVASPVAASAAEPAPPPAAVGTVTPPATTPAATPPPVQIGAHIDIDADAATDDERNRRPRYPRFGGDPEPPIEPGTWDPWAQSLPDRFSHDGFFLRLNLGPSYATVWRPDYQWTGLGLGLNISVGGSVVENLAIHADFRGTIVGNPTQRSKGRKTDFDADIVFESIGVGATYYVMPVNVYASVGAGVGVLAFEDDSGASKATSSGLTVSGTIGKEWWVGSDWGLGVAGQLLYMRVKDYVDDRRMHGMSVSLLFSATYN